MCLIGRFDRIVNTSFSGSLEIRILKVKKVAINLSLTLNFSFVIAMRSLEVIQEACR